MFISVVAVVVTYNRKTLLEECINNLLKQDAEADLSIYIVDNASTDGTKESLQKYINKGDICYFNTGSNLGGAGGFEYGVREAAKYDFDYVWIMDDDTIPSVTALKNLLEAADELGVFGFFSSKALWTDGSICTMNIQRKNIMKKLSAKELDGTFIPVEYATFVSLLIPMAVVREIGAPIGEFFIWGDDWEYTRRISKKYRSYVVVNSEVIHKTASNVGCDISNDCLDKISRYKFLFRNEAYIGKQDGIQGKVYHWLKVFKNIIKVLVKARAEKKKRLCIIIEGVKEGKHFRPENRPLDLNNN